MKSLQPKSEKCIYVGYYKYVKGYKLLQPHSHEFIIRREVKFDEIISAYKLNLAFVSCLAHDPSLASMPSSIPNFSIRDPTSVSSSDNDSEDENTPLPAHLPRVGSIEHEPAPTPQLPKWVHTTQEAVGDLVNDPTDQHHTRSQF